MSRAKVLQLVMVGLIGGCFAGVFGVGGGIVFVPALILILGKRPRDATATSLAIIAPTSVIAAIRYQQELADTGGKGVDLSVAIPLAIGAILGTLFLGVPLASRVSGDALKRGFGLLLALVGLKMLLAPGAVGHLGTSPVSVGIAGIAVGTASGFFGIGGGVVAVPLLGMVFGVAQHLAQGTSIAMSCPTVLAGVIRAHYLADVEVDYRLAAIVAPASMLGSCLGVALAGGTPDAGLRRGFAIMLIATALRMAGPVAMLRRKRAEPHPSG